MADPNLSNPLCGLSKPFGGVIHLRKSGGEAGLIRAFVTTLAPSVGFELFLFKSDTNGLTQVTP